MRLFLLILIFTLLNQALALANDTFKFDPETEFNAVTYSFKAMKASFKGQDLGYISSQPKSFSKKYWIYLSCDIDKSDPDSNGICMEWKIINAQTGKVEKLKLPAFDSFWSYPEFSWPYVAYVQINKPYQQELQAVDCVVYDFNKKAIVKRQKALVSEDIFATDYPYAFAPPTLQRKHGHINFSFYTDASSELNKICNLSIP